MEHFAGYKMSALVLTRNWSEPASDFFQNFSVKPHERMFRSVLTATVSGKTCCDRVLPPC